MSAAITSFLQRCEVAKSTIRFEETKQQIQEALGIVEAAQEIAPFLRKQLVDRAAETVEGLEARQTSAIELLGVLNEYTATPTPSIADAGALEAWFIKVAYASTTEVLTDEIISAVRELCRRNPEFGINKRLEDVRRRVRRIEAFATTSINPQLTLTSTFGIESVIRSLPADAKQTQPLLATIARARQTALDRSKVPLVELIRNSFASYTSILDKLSKGERLEQETSYIFQMNLFTARKVLDESDLGEEDRGAFTSQLDPIAERFDRVRFMGSTAVFKSLYEPRLAELQVELDQTLRFDVVRTELNAIRAKSKRGAHGVDRMQPYHQNLVAAAVTELEKKLNERQGDPEAVAREVRYLSGEVAALEAKEVLTSRAVRSIQQIVQCCISWAQQSATDQLPCLKDLSGKCDELISVVPTRYCAYIQNIENQLASLDTAVSSLQDVREVFAEMREWKGWLDDPGNNLRHTDRDRLYLHFRGVRDRFFSRVNDSSALRNAFQEFEQVLGRAAHNIRRTVDIDKHEDYAHMLGFWTRIGRFAENEQLQMITLARRTYGRIRGLRKKREEYLAERAKDQADLFSEMSKVINECRTAALQRPGDHGSWEALVEADRQLRDAHLLTAEQVETLRKCLDEAFTAIREERAQFAREASLAYAKYLDEIQNAQQPLERTSPPPTREDAFQAIELTKPLRARLREEKRLLRSHRQELMSALRIVSDSIDEILGQWNVQRQQNFVALTARVDEMEERIRGIRQAQDLRLVVDLYRALQQTARATELSLDGRKECRSALEHLWTLIAEKKQEFGRERFSADRINETLARLENEGFFLWMRDIPQVG